MGECCSVCGKKRIVDAPPFAEMSEQDIAEWRAAGGQIVLLECTNGCVDAEASRAPPLPEGTGIRTEDSL